MTQQILPYNYVTDKKNMSPHNFVISQLYLYCNCFVWYCRCRGWMPLSIQNCIMAYNIIYAISILCAVSIPITQQSTFFMSLIIRVTAFRLYCMHMQQMTLIFPESHHHQYWAYFWECWYFYHFLFSTNLVYLDLP